MKCIVFLACLALASASSKKFTTEKNVEAHEDSSYNPSQYLSYYQNYQGLPWYPQSYANYVQNPMYQSGVYTQYPWTQAPEFQRYWMNQYYNYPQGKYQSAEQSWPKYQSSQFPEFQKYWMNKYYNYPQGKYQSGEQSWPKYEGSRFPEFQKYWMNQYSNYPQGKYQYGEHPYVQYPWTQHEQFEGQNFPLNWMHKPQEYIQGKPEYEREQFHDSPLYWKNLWTSGPWSQESFVGYNQQVPSWYQQWSKYPQQYEHYY